jgi:hypothetical protein
MFSFVLLTLLCLNFQSPETLYEFKIISSNYQIKYIEETIKAENIVQTAAFS